MTIRSTISVVASANDHIENVNAQIKDLEERIGGKEVYRSAGDGTTVTMWCRACDHPFDVCSACKNIEALESELATLRAQVLPEAVVKAVRHCQAVANGPTMYRIDAMHAPRQVIEADAKEREG